MHRKVTEYKLNAFKLIKCKINVLVMHIPIDVIKVSRACNCFLPLYAKRNGLLRLVLIYIIFMIALKFVDIRV
jgi:hypothetical protein